LEKAEVTHENKQNCIKSRIQVKTFVIINLTQLTRTAFWPVGYFFLATWNGIELFMYVLCVTALWVGFLPPR